MGRLGELALVSRGDGGRLELGLAEAAVSTLSLPSWQKRTELEGRFRQLTRRREQLEWVDRLRLVESKRSR